MKFKEYISKNQAFTTDMLAAALDSPLSAKTLIKRAVASGDIERVRRGVYVSRTGRFDDAKADPFRVVSTVDDEAVLSFHSALEAHGVAHTVSAFCQFRSLHIRTNFKYGGILYASYPWQDGIAVRKIQGKAFGTAMVTTREQTIIDCLAYPERSGGIEEALRSLSAFPYVDQSALRNIVDTCDASLAVRVGWLLDVRREIWRIDPAFLEYLESRRGVGPARLDKRSKVSNGWSAKWRLCLPDDEKEIMSWLF